MPKILEYDRPGGLSALRVVSVDAPKPGPGEVRYRVAAFALNQADLICLDSGHPTVTRYPARIGYEACGIVDAVGEGVSGFRVGDRVTAIPYFDGRYCVAGEFAVTPEAFLLPWPDHLSAVEACAVTMQYFTAYFALIELGNLRAGDWVLVGAGASSAGLGAIQLARLEGARVIATTRSASKRAAIEAAGADAVFVSGAEPIAERILAVTNGRGARVVYDPIGGSFACDYAEGLAQDARIFVYGVFGGATLSAPLVPLVLRNATITAYSMANYSCDPRGLARAKSYVGERLAAGALRPVIDRVFAFDEVDAAFAHLESGAQKGKIVVQIDVAF